MRPVRHSSTRGQPRRLGNIFQNCQANSADISTTDNVDNWNRVEVEEGVNNVGSGDGQKQLCGSENKPVGLQVDFARSSKPSSNISGCNEQEFGYAKDGVPIVDFPTINPSTFGTSTQPGVAAAAYPASNFTSINGGVVGPVANGWLPADNPAGSANHGTRLTSISNVGAIDTSVAFRMWCLPHGNATSIGDWGQLTNLGPNIEVKVTTTATSQLDQHRFLERYRLPGDHRLWQRGDRSVRDPQHDAVPVGNEHDVGGRRCDAHPQQSGLHQWDLHADLCDRCRKAGRRLGRASRSPDSAPGREHRLGNVGDVLRVRERANAGSVLSVHEQQRPPERECGERPELRHGARWAIRSTSRSENNAHQIELFSTGDFPTSTADQAIEEATTLYFMSNGVYNTNAYVGATTIGATNFAANIIAENSVFPGSTTDLNNTFPTARTLFNITNSATVRNSVAGLMNWICDSNSLVTKGTDLSTGLNTDAELSNTISTQFGFPRLSDTSTPVAIGTPADNVPSPTDTCVGQIPVTVAGDGTTITEQSSGNFPTDLINGGSVVGTGVPSGTTLTSAGGGANITLSNPLPPGTTTLEFTGVPPVVHRLGYAVTEQ